MSGGSQILSGLGELLLVRRTAARVMRIPAAVRGEAAEAAAASAQRGEAAEALWAAGHPAEGLRLAVEALDMALGALMPVRAPLGEDSTAGVLAALGVDARGAARLLGARDAAHAGELPRLDAGVSASHARLYRRVAAAQRMAVRALGRAAMTRRSLALERAFRVGLVACAAALAVLAAVAVVRVRGRITSEASAVLRGDRKYEAGKAVDGKAGTEWLLPDGQTGWIEIRMRPRAVARVLLLNAHNPGYNDRATKDFALELYGDGALLATVDARFGSFDPVPGWLAVPVDAGSVDRVRLEVRSFHGVGGGIAEIDLE